MAIFGGYFRVGDHGGRQTGNSRHNIPLPVTLWDVTNSLFALEDHKNMGIAVGISPLSSLQDEIYLFPAAISGLATAMLDLSLSVTLWDVTSSLIELGTTKIWV